jgi:cellobiose transport system substrate-binding protein
MKRSWFHWARATAVGAVSLVMVAACSGNSGNSGGSDSAGGPVTLKINFWGDFGLQDLKAKYEAEHPNVKIQLNSGEYNAQHEDLQKKLVAGSGAADIAAIDEGFMVQFRGQSDKFVNLLDKGAGKYESKYLPWKWKQSLTQDGKTQIGLGTDVGGLAMCYRTDLFKAAGLPTERDQVSALWPTWDKFIEVGQQYTGKTNKKFIDSGTNLFNPILGQQPVGFYNEQDQLQMEQGPKVAFDYTIKAIQAGLSANLASFQADWDKGFTSGSFAVLACPAWMLGHIKDTAPGTQGKWDIAAVPGGGAAGVAGPAGTADRDLQEGRQPAVAAGALRRPGDRRLQEPVLQQRARRADLPEDGAGPHPAVPGQKERSDPGGGRERHHPRTEQDPEARRRVGGGGQGGREGRQVLTRR